MISLIIIILAAIANAVMDKCQFHYGSSVFKKLNPKFWNPKISWMNKWKNGDYTQGEKFLGSSTFLVWTQDAWHLFKTLQLTFFQLAIISVFFFSLPIFHENMWIMIGLNFILFKVVYGGVFTLFFSYVFNKE